MPETDAHSTITQAPVLGVQEQALLAGVRRWVECESPSTDLGAVQRMLDLAASDLALAGAHVQRLATGPTTADAVLGHFPHPRMGQPGILVMGHLDTVHPIGTLQTLPFRREGQRCYGPGIADMKAGSYLSLYAMQQLRAHGLTTPLPVSILYTGDEETGSAASRALIEQLARQSRYVLVPEPAMSQSCLVTGRLEFLRFTLHATGTPTHAGKTPEEGQSAIRLMAAKIIAIESLSNADAAFSVGIVRGGQWSNCVAAECSAEMLMLVREASRREASIQALMALQSQTETQSFRIRPLRQRPRWDPSEATLRMARTAQAIGAELGLALPAIISGGGSDGNFTGALGIATLDGLGACGSLNHTLQEHIFVDSLVPRTLLMANLLRQLC